MLNHCDDINHIFSSRPRTAQTKIEVTRRPTSSQWIGGEGVLKTLASLGKKLSRYFIVTDNIIL
jgi:hypothetical protein